MKVYKFVITGIFTLIMTLYGHSQIYRVDIKEPFYFDSNSIVSNKIHQLKFKEYIISGKNRKELFDSFTIDFNKRGNPDSLKRFAQNKVYSSEPMSKFLEDYIDISGKRLQAKFKEAKLVFDDNYRLISYVRTTQDSYQNQSFERANFLYDELSRLISLEVKYNIGSTDFSNPDVVGGYQFIYDKEKLKIVIAKTSENRIYKKTLTLYKYVENVLEKVLVYDYDNLNLEREIIVSRN